MGGESPPSTSMIDYGTEATHTIGAFIDLNPLIREQVEREFAIDFVPWKVEVMPDGQQGQSVQMAMIDPLNTVWDKQPSNMTDVVQHYTLEFRDFYFHSSELVEEIHLQLAHCYIDGTTKVRCSVSDLHELQTWEHTYTLYAKRDSLMHEITMAFKANISTHHNCMEAIHEEFFVFKWRGQLVNLYDYSVARLQQVREQITDETAKSWLQCLAQERYPDISYL